ncbi:CBS domain-containing protein [Portibacter marinus]|uniref:CBS domain-containing protein n=1 Tax=Portibacter marinus TaxID=2898660 RepID=UPI001F1FE3D1|nr:CBS domain-containing protein [Portibacter marinus]
MSEIITADDLDQSISSLFPLILSYKEETMLMTTNLQAKDLMKTKVLTLHPKDRMERVKQIFDQYNIRHLPILVADRIVGIISKSDFLKVEGISRDSFDAFLTEKIMKLHHVEQYMTSQIICCDGETPLSKILDLFLCNEIHSLLVVEKGKLLGIITPQDILRVLRQEMGDE